MSLLSLPLSERLNCLQELLSCTGTMYSWVYDARGELLQSTCPDQVLHTVFTHIGCLREIQSYGVSHTRPLVLSLSLGLSWGVAFEHSEGQLRHMYVFGPVATGELSQAAIHEAIQTPEISAHWRPKLIAILRRIPAVMTTDFFRYTLMLHYCVTGQKLTTADIGFRSVDLEEIAREVPPRPDRMRTWTTEQALMHMITEGDLNYQGVLQQALNTSHGVRLRNSDSIEQARISQVVFISLCTRAAIQGGIDPDTAYARGDAYLEDTQRAHTISDLAQIGHSMYADFIQMVHEKKSGETHSKLIQACQDYIALHVEEKLTLRDIAAHVGYADYYLSRKFKEETGQGIREYIKACKIGRAKMLLETTALTLQEISDQLHFGSRSFFSQTFHEIVGIPPTQYRQEYQKL